MALLLIHDVLCVLSMDTWWNFGHELKKMGLEASNDTEYPLCTALLHEIAHFVDFLLVLPVVHCVCAHLRCFLQKFNKLLKIRKVVGIPQKAL